MPFSALPESKQGLSQLLRGFLAQLTEALVFACPCFRLQLFSTASPGSSLSILQWGTYHFLFTILTAPIFFPEVKSSIVHAPSSSVPRRAQGCQCFPPLAGTGWRKSSPLWDCRVYFHHPLSTLHSMNRYISIALYYLAPAAGDTDG